MKTLDEKIEKLAEEVHWVHCVHYELTHDKLHWTEGDFSKLDEETKQMDRDIVRAVLQGIQKELSTKVLV